MMEWKDVVEGGVEWMNCGKKTNMLNEEKRTVPLAWVEGQL